MRDDAGPKFKTEVELASAVASWAEAMGWSVYKEVHTSDGDIDLVLVQGRTLWAVETKLKLNHSVMDQTVKRLPWVHYVSAAVPKIKDRSWVVDSFFKDFGIGLLEVRHPDTCRYSFTQLDNGWTRTRQGPEFSVHWESVVSQELKPRVVRPSFLSHPDRWDKQPYRNKRAERLAEVRAFLSPLHKELQAGGRGGQLTPWRVTMIRVTEFLRIKGPSTVNEIVAGVEHHYGNVRAAKAGIYRMIAEIKKLDFVQVDRNGEAAWTLPEGK